MSSENSSSENDGSSPQNSSTGEKTDDKDIVIKNKDLSAEIFAYLPQQKRNDLFDKFPETLRLSKKCYYKINSVELDFRDQSEISIYIREAGGSRTKWTIHENETAIEKSKNLLNYYAARSFGMTLSVKGVNTFSLENLFRAKVLDIHITSDVYSLNSYFDLVDKTVLERVNIFEDSAFQLERLIDNPQLSNYNLILFVCGIDLKNIAKTEAKSITIWCQNRPDLFTTETALEMSKILENRPIGFKFSISHLSEPIDNVVSDLVSKHGWHKSRYGKRAFLFLEHSAIELHQITSTIHLEVTEKYIAILTDIEPTVLHTKRVNETMETSATEKDDTEEPAQKRHRE